MSRNITPRPVRAQGARDAHGSILSRGAGALYVHLHREAGLAHRHYVLKSWQVRLLAFLTSWPMIVLYIVGIATWGWLASQAARVPILQLQVTSLTADARRLDTLTATLTELQERYDHVQRLLSAASSGASSSTSPSTASRSRDAAAVPTRPTETTRAVVGGDTTRRGSDSTARRLAADSARAKQAADSAARKRAATDTTTRPPGAI